MNRNLYEQIVSLENVYKDKVSHKLSSLRLIAHNKKTTVYSCHRGVLFVGYRIFPYYRKLRRENISRFRKRMKIYSELEKKGIVDKDCIRESIRSWIAHAHHANTYRLHQKIFKELFFADNPYLCEDP